MHVLPTDKPSRLYLGDNGNLVFGIIKTYIQSRNENFTNQKIYITNDEEINDCYFLNTFTNKISWTKVSIGIQENAKKIILTTDQDLIKDGVQAIDDEFLEWFVSKANDSGKPIDIVDVISIMPKGYKIIIPKEESKIYTQNDYFNDELCTCKTNEDLRLCKKIKDVFGCGLKEIPKQETMYSEEEVLVLDLILTSAKLPFANNEKRIEWFNQFKKQIR